MSVPEKSTDEKRSRVLATLRTYRSMPFLELTSVCNIDDKELEEIVEDLAVKKLVKIINPGDLTEEIVTVREQAFAANVSSLLKEI
jgi:hypothetical protein